MAASGDRLALVTGAGGQVGRALVARVPAGWRVEALTRAECDIADPGAVDALGARLHGSGAALLINAAAYTAVDRAEEEEALATAVNAAAPGHLARACADAGVRLLHISTDFVFDGTATSPYLPEAQTSPLGVYGRSKLAGEQAVAAAGGNSLILRTSWVYSAHGHNFLRTMLRLHGERDTVGVVADQVGTPTAAASVADALWAAANRDTLSGLYHWSDDGQCSWFDFAVAIGEEAQSRGLVERAAQVRPIATEEYPTPARRPAYSVLDTTASRAQLQLTPRPWRDQLRVTLEELRGETLG